MLATLLLVLHLLQLCAGSCYFSAELQGEYLMQTITITSGAQTQIQYSVVKITAEAIPMWGLCHQREGDNVILNDSFNGTACIRCFHLKLHSPNVLQVHTCPTCLDQCYLTEEAARNTCPKGDDLASGRHKEISLFRTREIGGGSIRKMFCPIAGRYKFTYNLYNQTDNRVECSPSVSQLENCPDRTGGPGLEVHFQGCAHQYNEMTFDCLGDWPGPNGQRFLALQETNVPATGERPLYRCALYKEDEQRGSIMMAFSSDSTCTSDLYNASYGHMTWNLTAIPSVHWPSVVINSKCSFPYWSQGKWEHLNIDFNSLTYKDHYSYNAYTMRCAQAVNEERFVVFSKNGCGEEVYKCIKMKLRSGNVLEFQLGLTSSIFFNTSLCSDSNFLGNIWVTQARLEGRQVSPCPVTGDYTGFITNDSGLCARMASDQLHPEIMYFTVSDCEQQEVYEGRYRSGRQKRENQDIPEPVNNLTTIGVTNTTPVTVTEEIVHPTSPAQLNPEEVKAQPTPSTEESTEVRIEDSEQIESSMKEKTVVPDIISVFSSSTNGPVSTGSPSIELSNTPTFPTTYRPSRSFNPPNSWPPHPSPSWPAPNVIRTTFSPTPGLWNYSSQTNVRPSYQNPRPVDFYRTVGPTEFPYRGYHNNFRGTVATSYDHREMNSSFYNVRNNWSTMVPRDGYVSRPWLIPQQWPELPPRNYFNTTNRPNHFGARDYNYQDPRQNWNWEGRYRTVNFPYRPYQNTNPNYRRPIALPPIQLPPLPPDMSRPVQGAITVGRPRTIREEREYQCLGQWEEDGVTYTYTQRRDFGSYECFVGSILSNNEIYIKEAGEHCGRGIDPLRTGMKLQVRGGAKLADPNPPTTPPATSWFVTKRPSIPTKPWKPITGAPPRQSGATRATPLIVCVLVTVVALTLT